MSDCGYSHCYRRKSNRRSGDGAARAAPASGFRQASVPDPRMRRQRIADHPSMHLVRLEEGGREAGVFRFDPRRFARPVRARPSVISIGARFEHDRRRTAAFIESVYLARYDARIRAHYPNLVAVRAADGTLAAAAGFRIARQGRLFLEQYTGDDVDRIVGVARERIVEIGNLASAGGGASVFL